MKRDRYLSQIALRFEVQPVVALLGPRQCGKTTLARLYADRLPDLPATRFDLEDPTDLAALAEPKLALQDLRGLVIIDEIQRAPDLFPVLRVLVDRTCSRCCACWSTGPVTRHVSSSSAAPRAT